MRKLLLVVAMCLLAATASAGSKIRLFGPPSPIPGMFPATVAPYTFVTGFGPDGQTIEGVCGYYSAASRHAWFNCSWPLVIIPVPGGYAATLGAAVLGSQICCDVYGEHAPKPVYGPFVNYAGYTIATPVYGNTPYLLTP